MPIALPHWQPSAPLQPLRLDWLARAGVEVAVLRLDLLDPLISGNKWFKLKPHIATAAAAGAHGLISLGGAHSNHLHALAAAGHRFGFVTVGLLRGEAQDTPTVRDLQDFGMHLHWLGYGGYRQRHRADFWDDWLARYPALLPVNEGGGGLLAARACAEIVEMAQAQLSMLGWRDYHGWWLAAGTGTTAAGLVLAERGERMVHVAMAVPSGHGVEQQLPAILAEAGQGDAGYRLLDASRGGFGRLDAALAGCIRDCELQAELPLEPLYTGKAMLALRGEVEAGYFAPGTRLLMLHTGGLQGRRAMAQRLDELAATCAAHPD
ncbi:1-aminocyclopropane-1-carboxylate deaminase/D-cysteine desulfhydrase [Pseudomonas sp. Gutcm_11s]|uniref:1-aminocyclopropane-1-carboxylate deaminase/D-cysteine desulfhydrase n=1 Tax=Pseudomonas sp. Gutcm_11s TaxID=3026088 RepID=UPI00235FC7CF|nr:1-aminocyclopropane-1-carboxylate deaminase [Pseudomonas sp. Gutcm_11s]MDD0842624.1 1-aminocyclopropane-1-carboxylate deaminase [Pseudomonas sp. Gutcm_11s]